MKKNNQFFKPPYKKNGFPGKYSSAGKKLTQLAEWIPAQLEGLHQVSAAEINTLSGRHAPEIEMQLAYCAELQKALLKNHPYEKQGQLLQALVIRLESILNQMVNQCHRPPFPCRRKPLESLFQNPFLKQLAHTMKALYLQYPDSEERFFTQKNRLHSILISIEEPLSPKSRAMR